MQTTIVGMAKKRPGGKHVMPRTTIQIPIPWLDLARRQARRKEKPVLWHILSLLAEEAARNDDERS